MNEHDIGKAALDLLSKMGLASVSRPMLTRFQANADAYANITTALANVIGDCIEADLSAPSMLEALISCGGKTNLENLARIVLKTLPQLTDDAKPDLISDDFAANFRDKVRTCSDPEMADLWAQLLAGEANARGSFSRKTVNILADMEPEDARLFRRVANFRVVHASYLFSEYPPEMQEGGQQRRSRLIILNENDAIYTDAGVDFDCLTRLAWLGLVTFQNTGFALILGTDKFIAFEYGGGYFLLSNNGPVYTGTYNFTPAGEELASLCRPLDSQVEFGEYIANFWRANGARVARKLDDFIAYGLIAEE